MARYTGSTLQWTRWARKWGPMLGGGAVSIYLGQRMGDRLFGEEPEKDERSAALRAQQAHEGGTHRTQLRYSPYWGEHAAPTSPIRSISDSIGGSIHTTPAGSWQSLQHPAQNSAGGTAHWGGTPGISSSGGKFVQTGEMAVKREELENHPKHPVQGIGSTQGRGDRQKTRDLAIRNFIDNKYDKHTLACPEVPGFGDSAAQRTMWQTECPEHTGIPNPTIAAYWGTACVGTDHRKETDGRPIYADIPEHYADRKNWHDFNYCLAGGDEQHETQKLQNMLTCEIVSGWMSGRYADALVIPPTGRWDFPGWDSYGQSKQRGTGGGSGLTAYGLGTGRWEPTAYAHDLPREKGDIGRHTWVPPYGWTRTPVQGRGSPFDTAQLSGVLKNMTFQKWTEWPVALDEDGKPLRDDPTYVTTKTVPFGPEYTYSTWTGTLPHASGGEDGTEFPRYEKEQPVQHWTWDKPEEVAALSPTEFRRFPMQWSRYITWNSKVCRFMLPTLHHRSGIDTAGCLVAKIKDEDGKEVIRPYTPISADWHLGFLDLLVKKYPGGKMGTHIHKMGPGDTLEMKGPFKKINIRANDFAHVGMICGGTGITPMYQVMLKILKDARNKTHVSCIYANDNPADILLVKELADMQLRGPEHFAVYMTVLDTDWTWPGGIGFINKDMIRAFMPRPGTGNKILVCGPEGLYKAVCGSHGPNGTQGELDGMLKELGYKAEEVFKF